MSGPKELAIQSVKMADEMRTTLGNDYSIDGLPLLLHQVGSWSVSMATIKYHIYEIYIHNQIIKTLISIY